MSNILVTTNQNVIDVTTTSGITVTTPQGQTINVNVPNSSVNVTNTIDEITVLTNGQITYNITASNTDQIPEGENNLYYTDARADARVQLGIDNIDFPVDSVNGQTNIVVLTTDNINEGESNLYFTDTRVDNWLRNNFITTPNGSTINNTELRAATGGYAVITDQEENNYFYVDDNVTQATAGTYNWQFNNDGTTQFPGYKFPQTDGTANQVLKTDGAGQLTWQNDANTDAVQSVNSQTGVVVLTTTDISEGTNLYYTEARVDAHVFNSVNIDNRSYLDTLTLTTSTTTADQVVDSFSLSTYRTVKYLISITSSSNYQTVEMLVVHDGTTANQVTYADLATNNNLATFTVDISGGNVRLLTTPTNSVTVYKLTRTTIVV